MIPNCIGRQHILEAIERIDRDGVPSGRGGWKFAISYEGRRYPPKLL